MSEGTCWERLRWWFTWRVWRPLLRRCSFCGTDLDEDDYCEGAPYGWGAWSCAGCTEYPEG